MKDYYATIGVSPDASIETIKAAYRKKAAQLHPDRNPSPDAAARFVEIQKAYDVLFDPTQRKSYDEYRQRSLIDNPQQVAMEIFENYIRSVTNEKV